MLAEKLLLTAGVAISAPFRVQGRWDQKPWTWTGIDLVEGAAGVALVLLAATTSVEPLWDRMFLVSAPTTITSTPA